MDLCRLRAWSGGAGAQECMTGALGAGEVLCSPICRVSDASDPIHSSIGSDARPRPHPCMQGLMHRTLSTLSTLSPYMQGLMHQTPKPCTDLLSFRFGRIRPRTSGRPASRTIQVVPLKGCEPGRALTARRPTRSSLQKRVRVFDCDGS